MAMFITRYVHAAPPQETARMIRNVFEIRSRNTPEFSYLYPRMVGGYDNGPLDEAQRELVLGDRTSIKW